MSGESFLARLSLAGVGYGEATGIDDLDLLAERLYLYNRVPLSPRWTRRFPDQASVLEYLGVDSRPVPEGSGAWTRRRTADGWMSWSRQDGKSKAKASSVTHKLYLSPTPESLPDVFPAFLDVLITSRARRFKAGAEACDLLRSDKLVAYFGHQDDLIEAAERILSRLDGAPVQGVPFTAELGGGGLVSWGVDPPRRKGCRHDSWRGWLTRRLAAAILSTKETQLGGMTRTRCALERLRIEGVDVERWAPAPGLWTSSGPEDL